MAEERGCVPEGYKLVFETSGAVNHGLGDRCECHPGDSFTYDFVNRDTYWDIYRWETLDGQWCSDPRLPPSGPDIIDLFLKATA
jgi:hypothetical protein